MSRISTEAAIQEILTRMETGRFKVFADCKPLFDELRKYHRRQGKIVKIHDDVLDAMRYSALSVGRFGVPKGELKMPELYGRHPISLTHDWDI
jgi:hypothetical protein